MCRWKVEEEEERKGRGRNGGYVRRRRRLEYYLIRCIKIRESTNLILNKENKRKERRKRERVTEKSLSKQN